MNWYSVKIIFQIIVGEAVAACEFDEQLILIQAGTKTAAFQQGTYIGIARQDSFLNVNEQEVKWKFVNVAAINELGELANGSELYSQINKYENAEQHIDVIHRRAAQISNLNSLDWVQLI